MRSRTIIETVVKKIYPTVKEFGEHLKKNPECLKFEIKDDENKTQVMTIQAELLQSSSKYFHLVFWDEELLKEFSSNDQFGDGTFSIRPDVEGIVQVFVVMAKKHLVVSNCFY